MADNHSVVDTPESFASSSNIMLVLAQILTGLGMAAMLIGAAVLVIALVQEIGGDDGAFQIMEVVASGSLLFDGLVVAGVGQALRAIRSIAISTAAMAAK